MASTARESERELLRRAKSGDEKAFAQLFSRYRNVIRMTLRSQIRGDLRAKLDDSDLLQETFLTASRSIADFEGRTIDKFLRWIQVIAGRRVADAYRRFLDFDKRDMRKEVPLEQILSRADQSSVRLIEGLADSASGPLSVAQRQEQFIRLADAMALLPAHYREVLEMHYLEQCRLSEIAAVLGRSKGATAMLIHRAIEKLRIVMRESSRG